MPRQIIDTESSRPAYVRRRIATFVAASVLIAVVLAAGWFLVRNRSAVPVPAQSSQGNSPH